MVVPQRLRKLHNTRRSVEAINAVNHDTGFATSSQLPLSHLLGSHIRSTNWLPSRGDLQARGPLPIGAKYVQLVPEQSNAYPGTSLCQWMIAEPETLSLSKGLLYQHESDPSSNLQLNSTQIAARQHAKTFRARLDRTLLHTPTLTGACVYPGREFIVGLMLSTRSSILARVRPRLFSHLFLHRTTGIKRARSSVFGFLLILRGPARRAVVEQQCTVTK